MAALATETLVADPDVTLIDSCTVPDHRIMNRLWRDWLALGTLVIGVGSARSDNGRRCGGRHRSVASPP